MAHALSSTGASVLLVERGQPVPQEAENWDPAAVWRDKRYRAEEHWLDRRGRLFPPVIHYVVGGNTKVLGRVVYPLPPGGFDAAGDAGGGSPPPPIGHDTLP